MVKTSKNINDKLSKKKYKLLIIKNKRTNLKHKTYKYKKYHKTQIRSNSNGNNNHNHNSNHNKFKTQKAGFFNILKHWKNMYKFNRLVKNLQKEEIDIKKVIGSYKVNANDFKNLAENKRDRTTEYILNKRQQIIIDFSKPKGVDMNSTSHNNKDYIKVLRQFHDSDLITSKESALELGIDEADKKVIKRIPEFIKDKKKLENKTKNFRKLIEKLSSGELGKFQAKIKLMKKEYDEIVVQPKDSLKSMHKTVLKNYGSHKADFEKVNKIDETYIQQQQALVHEILDLLAQSELYIEQIEKLDKKKTDKETDLVKWVKIYTRIYELIQKILKNIIDTKKQLESIKEKEVEIDMAVHPLAQTSTNLNLKNSSARLKDAQRIFDNVIKYLDASAVNINQVLDMLLNEKMASEIYLDSSKIATAFYGMLTILKNYKIIFTPGTITMIGGSGSYGGSGVSRGSKKGAIGAIGTGSRLIHPSPTIGSIKILNPICYDDSVQVFDIEINSRFLTNKETILFIYNTSFDEYINDVKNNYNNKNIEYYRQDIYTTDTETKIKSLGIPIDNDETDINISSFTIIDILNPTHVPKFTKINTIPNFEKINNKTTIDTLLKQSFINIFKYIENPSNNINIIYYYADYECSKLSNTTYMLEPDTDNSEFLNYNRNKKIYTTLLAEFITHLQIAPYNFKFNTAIGTPAPGTSGTPAPGTSGTSAAAAGTSAAALGTAAAPEISLKKYIVNINHLLENEQKVIINLKHSDGKSYTDDNGNVIDKNNLPPTITINGMIGTIQSDGTIFINPTTSENSPIRSIIKNITDMNQTNNLYKNNIDIITKNTKYIYDTIDSIIKPDSKFMDLTKDIQELTQLLINLKYIEPKVINVELDKLPRVAKQYSWILKPVEINKTEFHALSGTETLDKLIKENKSMQEFHTKNNYIPDNEIENLIKLLAASTHSNIPPKDSTTLTKIVDSNFENFMQRCKDFVSSPGNDINMSMCNILSNLNNFKGIRYLQNYKDQYNCRGKGSDRGGRGRGRGRGGRGNSNSYGYGYGRGNSNGYSYGVF